MKLWTYAEAKAKIQRDLDLTEETFVSDQELKEYFNDAIDEAEAEIHNLYEDYFLSEATITLAIGTNRYALPTDIYANKIRNLWFKQNDCWYQIKRTRHKDRPAQNIDKNLEYTFQIQHRTPSEGITLRLFPDVSHDGPYVEMQYIRNANRIVLDTDLIDMPECIAFIFAFVKEKVCDKESHPLLASAQVKLEKQRELMLTTLKTMVPDEDNNIDPDMSFYEDMN